MTPAAPPAPAPLDLEAVRVRLDVRQKFVTSARHVFGELMNEPTLKLLDTIDAQNADIRALVTEVERLREEIRRLKYLELLDAYEDEDNQEERRP